MKFYYWPNFELLFGSACGMGSSKHDVITEILRNYKGHYREELKQELNSREPIVSEVTTGIYRSEYEG